jgi:hypothetical protein
MLLQIVPVPPTVYLPTGRQQWRSSAGVATRASGDRDYVLQTSQVQSIIAQLTGAFGGVCELRSEGYYNLQAGTWARNTAAAQHPY